jgi:hypothetical protein
MVSPHRPRQSDRLCIEDAEPCQARLCFHRPPHFFAHGPRVDLEAFAPISPARNYPAGRPHRAPSIGTSLTGSTARSFPGSSLASVVLRLHRPSEHVELTGHASCFFTLEAFDDVSHERKKSAPPKFRHSFQGSQTFSRFYPSRTFHVAGLIYRVLPKNPAHS